MPVASITSLSPCAHPSPIRASMICQCQYCKNPRARENTHICQATGSNPCEPCGRVIELDEKIHEKLKKIEELTKTVGELEKERREWKVQINSNHDLIARRVPPEIITKIFAFSIPQDEASLDLVGLKLDKMLGAPLILSAVSQRWRTIAHSTPQLWTYVPLILSSSNASSLPLLAKEWIERSGQEPLSINIFARNKIGIKGLIKVINRYSSRWAELRYDGDPENLSYFSSDQKGTSQLKTLGFATSFYRDAGKFDLGKFVIQPVFITLASISSSQIDNMDWTHLTQLDMINLRAEECLEVLRKAPNVRLAIFSLTDPLFLLLGASRFSFPNQPILHSALEHLTITGYHSGSDIYAHLLCPSLDTLGINGLEEGAQMRLLINFLRKSSNLCLLLHNMKLSTDDIKQFCQGIPGMCLLGMENVVPMSSQLKNHLFSFLGRASGAGDSTKPLYFPDLRDLTIEQDNELGLALLPSIFCVPGRSSVHRRELKAVEVIIKSEKESVVNAVKEVIRKKQQQISFLKEQGVKLVVRVGNDRKNLIC